MKPLIKPLFLSCYLLFFTIVSAQNKLGDHQNTQGRTTSEMYDNITTNDGSVNTRLKENLGTPSSIYFNDWTVGRVVLTDNTVYNDWLLRYNIYNQQMQFIHNSDTSAFGKPEEISSITINQHTFVFQEFECENNTKRKGYLELLVDGNCKLYVHRCIAYRYVEECPEPGSGFLTQEYYMAKRYFISEDDGSIVFLPEKKKEIIDILDDENAEIKQYIKENKIKLCNEDDLKELITYYNLQ